MRLIQTCLFVAGLGTVVFQDKKFLKFQHIFQDIKLRKHVEKCHFYLTLRQLPGLVNNLVFFTKNSFFSF